MTEEMCATSFQTLQLLALVQKLLAKITIDKLLY